MANEGTKGIEFQDTMDGITPGDSPQLPQVEPYRMPPYLIAVICLGTLLGFVIIFKIYKQLRTKKITIPCCGESTPGSTLQRGDTMKPLIRTSSNTSDGGSAYRNNLAGRKPDMV